LLIPNLKNFSARYKMLTQNMFIMGAENKPLEMETVSILQINQRIYDDFIETAVTVEHIKGSTANKELQDHLDTTLALSYVSKTLVFQRNAIGKFMYITNKPQLKKDWEKWKSTEINKVFKEKKEQDKSIRNYEKGFEKMDQAIPLSFQNALLIPALYGFKSYQDVSNCFSLQSINSKLIADLILKYEICSTNIEINNIGEANISLESRLLNKDVMKTALEKIYESLKNFQLKIISLGFL